MLLERLKLMKIEENLPKQSDFIAIIRELITKRINSFNQDNFANAKELVKIFQWHFDDCFYALA